MLGDKDGAHEDNVALILREADACPEDARANRISTLESCAHTDAGNIDPLEKNDNTERYQANVVQKNTFFWKSVMQLRRPLAQSRQTPNDE